ncbi:MAG: hypothetical protein MR919_12875 [Parabacteroides sp.]|nr:hypothetical protein [Parabacteroides sp.]
MNKSIIICLICSMALSMPYASFAQGRIVRPSKQQTEQTQTAVPKQENPQRAEPPKKTIKQQVSRDEYGICQDQIVDLGLSVKWAGWNIGASAPEQPGQIFGWGDPSGQETVADESKYPSMNPPKNICGDPRYDMATANWGKPWQLPSVQEMEELLYKCEWEYTQYKGYKGYKITGPNGNAIFLPYTPIRRAVYDNNEKRYSKLVTNASPEKLLYYVGELAAGFSVQLLEVWSSPKLSAENKEATKNQNQVSSGVTLKALPRLSVAAQTSKKTSSTSGPEKPQSKKIGFGYFRYEAFPVRAVYVQ